MRIEFHMYGRSLLYIACILINFFSSYVCMCCTDSPFHTTIDISLDLLHRFPKLAITKDHSGESPLNELASTRVLFSDASQLGIWKRLIYRCK